MTDQQFARTELMLGAEGLRRVREAFVVVVGLGAVGGYAAEALARCGFGKMRLIDFDTVEPSNINRQLYALNSTVGMAKTEVAARRIADINPACVIKPLNMFVSAENMAEVFKNKPDYIVDAIDNVVSKAALIKAAGEAGIPIISSMGAAQRTDPSLVRVGYIEDVCGCPLARKVRKLLRKAGASTRMPCVYSTEEVRGTRGTPLTEFDPRRRTPIPSLPTLTGIFGLIAAGHVIKEISGV